MPPKCSICTHEQVADIDKAITRHESFRNIASQFGDFSYGAVARHTENCLKLDLQALREGERVSRVVDVYTEFEKNLSFVEHLREAAITYLLVDSDPTDPLKLTLVPQAHEIDVVYDDYNDMKEIKPGFDVPTRKTTRLDVLLDNLRQGGAHPVEIKMKVTDIRKFALECVDRIDMSLDKFARMSGAYQKNKPNENDPQHLIDQLVQRLIQKGWDATTAREFAKSKYQDLPKLIPAKVG
jgi:hypothetical protein